MYQDSSLAHELDGIRKPDVKFRLGKFMNDPAFSFARESIFSAASLDMTNSQKDKRAFRWSWELVGVLKRKKTRQKEQGKRLSISRKRNRKNSDISSLHVDGNHM